MRNLYFSDYNVSTKNCPNSSCLPLECRSASAGRFQAGPAELLPAAEAAVLGKGPGPTDTSRSGGLLEWVLCHMSECLKRGRGRESKCL